MNVVPIDSKAVELAELVKQVLESGEARVVRREAEGLAIISPLARPRTTSRQAHARFLSAAGAWKGVDVEAMKRRVRERRDAKRFNP